MAQNAVLIAENCQLSLQNKERIRRRATGNWILSRAKLMTAENIATACSVRQEGLAVAKPSDLSLQQQSPTAIAQKGEATVPVIALPIAIEPADP